MTTTRTVKRSCRTCGWTGTYDSPARGDYAKRLHSCERQLTKAATKANGEKIRAGVDRTPKPCTHKVANHQHGTYACYVLDRCRCEPCATARGEYTRRSNKDKAYGRWNRYVDAEPARAHVRRLQALGMGWKRIALAAGLDTSIVWKLLYGDSTRNLAPSKRIRPATAEALLAVELDLAPGAIIDSTGTARRIQALAALGYSLTEIGAQVGIQPGNFTDVAHGRTAVTVATATAIADLYDRWSMTVPPAETRVEKYRVTRAKNYATSLKWAPPLAWDDETIDDPAARPAPWLTENRDRSEVVDHAAVERAITGDRTVQLTVADRREVVRVLHGRGLNDVQIRELTGMAQETAARIRKEIGLPGVTGAHDLGPAALGMGKKSRKNRKDAA